MPETNATKSFAVKTVAVNMDSRTVEHYITAPQLDEDGEVLLPRGADLSRFKKSSVVFDVHQYGSRDVVGRCLNLKMQDDGIIATTRFSPRPPSLPDGQEWWPDTLLWLYNIGDIKGWSVGFSILDARNPTKQDAAKWGDRLNRVITRWRLLEYSVAPLPCLESALTLSMKGMISQRLAETLKSGRLPTRNEYAVAPKQIITLSIAPEPKPVTRKIVMLIPPEPKEVAPVVKAVSLEDVASAAAELAIRKARGQILA